MEIILDKIDIDKEQPRKAFEDIGELSASILKNGLLEPLKIIKKGDRYKLIDGERRYRAMKLLKEKKAECIILDNKKENLITQLAYDVSKRKLTIMEEAEAFKKLLDGDMDIHEIAGRLGIKITYISRRMKLFALTSKTRELISKKIIPASDVLELDFNIYKQHEQAINSRIENEVGFFKADKSKEKIKRIIKEETNKESGVISNFKSDLNKFDEVIDSFNIKSQDFDIRDFFGENLLQTIIKLDKSIEKVNNLIRVKENLEGIKKRLGELRLKYGVGTIIDNKLIEEGKIR